MILVLGIGNVLWADEGFGVRCVEYLHDTWELFEDDDDVRVMDGGTQGLYLVPYVTECRQLLVFDAVDFAAEPASLHVVRGDEVPAVMGAHAMSLHQMGFQDVLAAATLLGRAPESITLVGVQPVELENYGGGLTEPVGARLDDAIAIAIEELRAWGVSASPRTRRAEPLHAESIARHVYEGAR